MTPAESLLEDAVTVLMCNQIRFALDAYQKEGQVSQLRYALAVLRELIHREGKG